MSTASTFHHFPPVLYHVKGRREQDGPHSTQRLELVLPSVFRVDSPGRPSTFYQFTPDVLNDIEQAILNGDWHDLNVSRGHDDYAPPLPIAQVSHGQPSDLVVSRSVTRLPCPDSAEKWSTYVKRFVDARRYVERPDTFVKSYPSNGRGLSTVFQSNNPARLPAHVSFRPPLLAAGKTETFDFHRIPWRDSDGTKSLVSVSWINGPEKPLRFSVSGAVVQYGSSVGFIEGSSRQIGQTFAFDEANWLRSCVNTTLEHRDRRVTPYEYFSANKDQVTANLVNLCTALVNDRTKDGDELFNGPVNANKAHKYLGRLRGPGDRKLYQIEVLFDWHTQAAHTSSAMTSSSAAP